MFKLVANSITLSDFFKLDYEDQYYCHSQHFVKFSEFKITFKRIENDECIYFFTEEKLVKHSRKAFYLKTEKNSCIYYNKITKKIFIKKPKTILPFFLKHYFKYPDIVESIVLKGNIPKTFCKKVIDGKIVTLNDVVKFRAIYSLKDKSISSKALFNLYCIAPYKIGSIGNFDLFEDIQNCIDLEKSYNYELNNGRKVYTKEDLKLTPLEDYDDWRKKKDNSIVLKLGL